ncbi:unnamed protein product [Rangifer tarandus platyrhynchus]|uniref:Uncharacterized protein n=1 Tax=Rangifer tarandus platyrhynchus TaxID=3082113 RepID=A0AC60A9V9_RANTA
MHAGPLQSCPALCNPLDCGLPGFRVSGLLQARTLQRVCRHWLPCAPGFRVSGLLQARTLLRIGRHWLPHPPRALYCLLPWPPTPLRTWCCRNPCDPSSPTTSTPGPHRGKPKSSRAASGANPVGDPHAEVEIEPQLKPRGGVAKEEDPKPSPQLYKLQIKSTRSTRQTVSTEYIKGH